jgi:HTH-type transcriptional regulator, sugar sensing transcriptional regulator
MGVSMEGKVVQILERIGLSKNEIKIYLDLAQQDSSSALEISKRTQIHRSNTYDAIRKLIERGFISEIIEDKKKLFRAKEPEKIKDYIKQQEQEVESILPYLKMFSSEDNREKEGVSTAKGTFAVREALHDLLKLNKQINVYGASIKSIDAFGLGFLKDFHAERIKQKISMRHIYDADAIERTKYLTRMKLTEAKILPKKYYSIVSTNICGDTVMFLIFSNPASAIIIKNKSIAEAYSNYFEILWKQARVP